MGNSNQGQGTGRPPASGWWDDLEPFLSAPRLAPYLAAASGNHKLAIQLYQWNVELAGATYQALHILEVVLRNAIDRELQRWNSIQRHPGTGRHYAPEWLIDPAPLLSRVLRDDLAKATQRATTAAKAHHRKPSHGDILAQLTMGAWRYMLPDRRTSKQYLWRAALAQAFPHLARPAAQLVADVDSLHRLRNRVAHLETMLDTRKANAHFAAIRQVLSDIDPRTEQWFVSQQKITTVLRARPGP
jgi:hypothetical protein